MSDNRLIFNPTATLEFASCLFTGVPTILKCDDTPLIEFVKEEDAGFTTQIAIYHKDGTYLAKVKGSQLHLTEAGQAAGLRLRHPGLLTVCELGTDTLFELRRDDAAALKLRAELYTPTGGFMKCHSHIDYAYAFNYNNTAGPHGITVGLPQATQVLMKDLIFTGDNADGIGIHTHSEGWLEFAVKCRVRQDWKGDPVGVSPSIKTVRIHIPEGHPGLSNFKFGPGEVIAMANARRGT
jgi:hypothetical protein